MRIRSKPASSCARAKRLVYPGSMTGPSLRMVSEPFLVPIMPMNSTGMAVFLPVLLENGHGEGGAAERAEDRVVLRGVHAGAQHVAQVALQRVAPGQGVVADEGDGALHRVDRGAGADQ